MSKFARQAAKKLATLRLHGPDHQGIVAASSQILDKYGCAITKSEQFTDPLENYFYQRSVFKTSIEKKGSFLELNTEQKMQVEDDLLGLKERFGLDMAMVNWREKRKKVAIFVSKYDHCLWEILLRHEAKELDCDISVVISNHSKLQSVVETFGIPYKVFPITSENKSTQEALEIDLLKNQLNVDVIVLARYMQVLSHQVLESFDHDQIINIHHSFLPAFMGSRPHKRAHERGVKLVGATAHYVTEKLDEGPIIDQDVIGVTHRDGPHDLVRKGRIIERTVLVNALQAHLEDRVISHNSKCVVFNE